MSDLIDITISINPAEAAEMTYGARERWLGRMAEEKLASVIPPRPLKSEGALRNRWKPYTREGIAQAFAEWAKLHDGLAPSKKDWSQGRDPQGRWPRATSSSFTEALSSLASEDGINLASTAPHKHDPEHLARKEWHDADWNYRDAQKLGGGVQHERLYGGARVEYHPPDGADPGPYCKDCFHGSGCRPADMSPWQYAVEGIGGLRLRNGGDFHATRSRRDDFGRNRQTVTGGAAAAPDVVDIDASLERYIS